MLVPWVVLGLLQKGKELNESKSNGVGSLCLTQRPAGVAAAWTVLPTTLTVLQVGVPGGALPGLVLAAGQLAALVAHMPEAAFQVAGRALRGCPEMFGFQSVSGHQTNDQRSKNVGDDCPPSHLS